MQGATGKVEPLDFYPLIEDIFVELSRQNKTKITIPTIEKNINQLIINPLTDQEKEDDYEVHLHVSTFTLEDTREEEVNTLQVAVVPSMQHQIESTRQEEEAEQTDEET